MKAMMLRLIFAVCLSVSAYLGHAQSEPYNTRQLACGLSQPWEIKFGPNGWLWVTEAYSYQLSRVEPITGTTEMMLDLSGKKNFLNFGAAAPWPQGGLQGFAFHPDFNNNPYVYIGYVYQFDSCAAGTGGCLFKTKIVRYNYDTTTKVFSNETIVTDAIPGSNDHNAGRLVIGPAGGTTNFIFYSVGDMGAGHLSNGSRPHRGQQQAIWEGKILRFNLTADGDTGPDAWIPNDNPFNAGGIQNAVWSLGHRNPQGLAFAPDGTLYEAEHGPYSDDEINIIKPAYNYGFPLIVGYTDSNYDGSKAGIGSGIPPIISEFANRAAIQASFSYSDPIFSLFPGTKTEVSTLYNNDLNNTQPPNYSLFYPSSAASGIEHYSSGAIPGWQNSLLVANLKFGEVYRLKLSADGQSVVGDTISYFRGQGRFRDIAISPDGKKIYVSVDSFGSMKGPGATWATPPNKGCIMEFDFSAVASVVTVQHTNGILLYPNPANGSFTLQLPEGVKAADLQIANMLGSVVYAGRIPSNTSVIDLKSLPAGIYTVSVVSDRQTWHSNLMVR